MPRGGRPSLKLRHRAIPCTSLTAADQRVGKRGPYLLIFVILKCPFIARSLACLGERRDFKSRTATCEMSGLEMASSSQPAQNSQCHCLTSGHDVSRNLRSEYENGLPALDGRTRLPGLRRTLPRQSPGSDVNSDHLFPLFDPTPAETPMLSLGV